MAKEPKPKTEIFISLVGGNVQAIYSNDPSIKVNLIDWDNMVMDEDETKKGKILLEKAEKNHLIY
jgi:hypothetical protein